MDPIVLEIPSEFKTVADAVKKLIAVAGNHIAGFHGGKAVEFIDVETAIRDATCEIERATFEPVLTKLAATGERIEVGGRVYSRLPESRGVYRSQSGEISITRSLYREVVLRNGETVDPIGIRIGALDGWFPGAAKAMGRLLAMEPSREAEKTARELGRLPYSRTSFERVPHMLGTVLRPHQADIEDELIHEMPVPQEAVSVSVGLDRAAVPMEEPAKKPVGRPRKGAAKRPVTRQYRMAWCGTLTFHDAQGDAIQTIRYGRMPDGDSMALVEGLASDLKIVLEKRPDLIVVKMADGGTDLWNLLDEHITKEWLGQEARRVIDFWHLIEKLGAAARVIAPGASAKTVARWKSGLLERRGYALRVLSELRASDRRDVIVGDSVPIHEAITYIENNGDRMHYAALYEAGLPIGSGTVEATCKSLISLRMKRCGSRWKEDTGHDVIQLRAFALSDRGDLAMRKLFTRHSRAVRTAS